MSSKLGLMIVSAGLAFSACAPKDEKLGANGGGVSIAVAPASPEEAINMLLISLDRQVEALHYIKLALNPGYASKRNAKVASGDSKLIVSDQVRLETVDYTQTTSANVVASEIKYVDDAKTVIQSLTIKENPDVSQNQLLFTKLDPVRSYLKVTPLTKLITVSKDKTSKVDGSSTYSINAENYEMLTIKGKSAEALKSNTFTKFTIVWDGKAESLDQEIKIFSALVGHEKIGNTKYIATSLNSSLTVKLSDDCVSENGTITLLGTDKKNTFSVVFSDSSISVAGQATAFTAAACASRPVVDIRKLL